MWKPTLRTLALLLPIAHTSALPQSPAPAIPWTEKVDALRTYILTQTPSTKNAGFWNGPTYQLPFADSDCHQIRLYNWDCTFDIVYTMAGIAAWIDSQGFRNYNQTRFEDTYRYYNYGFYRDPEDGWGFYNVARLTYGPCGNRGPQSACGHRFCTERDGKDVKDVPGGLNPYQDPNDKNQVCSWLRNGSVGTA